MQPLYSGDHDHCISELNAVLSPWNGDFSFPVNAGNEKIVPDIQLCQRGVQKRAVLVYGELQGLCLVVQNLVEGFHIAADAVLHGTHVLQDIVSSQVFGIYNAAHVQAFYDIIKGNTVYL